MKVLGYDLGEKSQGINELLREIDSNKVVNTLVKAMSGNTF